MTAHQTFAFQRLLEAWRRREDARSAGTLHDLSNARASLDAARHDMQTSMTSMR